MDTKNFWYEAAGWVGGLLLLAAFALYSFGLIKGTSIWYEALNLVGSIGIVIVSFHKKAWPPGVLNVVWALVAAYSLYVYLVHPVL
jgi:hypothetical protein